MVALDHNLLLITVKFYISYQCIYIFLVFGALLAYAALLYVKFWSKEGRAIIVVTPQGKDPPPKKKTKEETIKTLNMYFLILLVLSFLFFNLIYWPVMLFG